MAHKRRPRVRYHSVRGGHYGYFGPRYLGYRMAVRAGHRRRQRTRNPAFFGNPFFARNPGGGTNWLLIGGVAVGAFFLLRGGALGNIFGGAAAPAGYTPLGTSGYYRGPDGQVYTRTATGQMVRSATQFPAGSTVEQQLIQQGIAAGIPLVAAGIREGGSILGDWLGNLFGGGSATGAIPSETGGTTVTAPDVLSGAYSAPLAPLPELSSLTLGGDWWSAPDTSSWFASSPTVAPGEPGYSLWGGETGSWSYGIPELPPLPSVEIAWVDPGFIQPSEPVGFWGFRGFAAARGGYGIARRGPAGEMEARFLRQPPSYR